ncbi:glycosyltransferase [Sphingomonas profundi]|uniref:glycosyltransferase n=1 Tax=Alterirhizorhabdus profundi TaxID=2681549 RepID=UPI0018D1D539|nr:glycosyltransferase [Sphingomonas profundi]
MSFLFKRKRTFRKLGNAHRDKGGWQEAAAAYRRHLDDEPDDVAIWVQLGHMEKESGRIAEAEAAYTQASVLAPTDPDPLLHLSHMLKSHARAEDAFDAFLRLFRIAPEEETREELQRLMPRRRVGATVTARPGAILFAMQDFFNSFAGNSTFTGIQRVQVGVALAAMADPAVDAHFIVNGADENDRATFLRLDETALRDIFAYVGGETVNHAVLLQLLRVAELGAAPISFGAGTTIVILGSFWGLGEGVARYLDAKRDGARLVAYVHDVIPASHPEYCDANLSNAFWRALAELLHVVDFMMTNSDFTQAELRRFIAEQGGTPVPMQTVPLAHSLEGAKAAGGAWPASLAGLRNERYVAYVSTVEGRKNHIYVVRAWQRMIENGVRVPDLVFVGRVGWKTDDLTALLRQTDNLGGRVHIVHGLSDAELNAVYAKAMFTVFTSLVEGWGLPVGESLVHGVPCVAANVASIPEVGGAFVDYVDPTDLEDGVRVLTRMIADDRYRTERRRAIREGFVPRSWRDVGDDLLAKLRAMIAAHPQVTPVTPVAFDDGRVFRPGGVMGRPRPVAGYFASPLGLAMATSFYEAEPGGAWLRGGSGELTFGTSVPPGEDIVVLLAIKTAPWALGRDISIDLPGSGTGPARWARLKSARTLLRIQGPVAADGTCTLMLRTDFEPEPIPGDTRRFAVALESLGYAPAGRPDARTELRETFLFT